MLSLDWPWLLLLIPLPWLVRRYAPAAERSSAALKVPFFQQLEQPTASRFFSQSSSLNQWLLWVLWLLLVLAAAKPVWVGDLQAVDSSARDLLLAVDISGSMETEDMQSEGVTVDRLAAVKSVLGDFIERRPSDRLGLILFGSQAYMQAPLTQDHQTLVRFLDEAQIGFAGDKTAIGDAIGLAIKRLTQRPDQSRVLVLLTDGANTAGAVSPIESAQLAAKHQIKIYTLGFGSDEAIVSGLFGLRRVNPSADLDEDTLKQIAQLTGGQYFRARNLDELTQIYQTLDELEPVTQEAQWLRPQKSYFHWPLAVALLITLGWAGLYLRSGLKLRLKSEPRPETVVGGEPHG